MTRGRSPWSKSKVGRGPTFSDFFEDFVGGGPRALPSVIWVLRSTWGMLELPSLDATDICIDRCHPLEKKLSAPKVGFLDGLLLLQCNGNSFYLRKLTTSSTTHNHSGPLHHVTRGLLAGLHCPVRLLLHSLQLQSLSFLLDRQWCDQGDFHSRLPEAGHFHFQELLVRR